MDGRIIGHYQLLERLGAGGMGEIYKAEDTRLHRIVAIKLLSPLIAADPERRKRFLQEAQAASALNHPNIITVYDIISDGDTQCIVMEYVAGKTLRDSIPAGGLAVPQALQYAVQMASALATAHSAMIIHRDLKPSNVMITPSNLVKILDFGLAKWIDPAPATGEEATIDHAQLTREGSIIGTVSYMSPEQAEGKRVDARSDIFAFGSVLYEMLTGRRAFEGTSGISTLSAILRDDVRPMCEAAPEVPPLLEQIVLRCLQKNPDSRWPGMKQLESALSNLQRQLDPAGQFAPPLSTMAMSERPTVLAEEIFAPPETWNVTAPAAVPAPGARPGEQTARASTSTAGRGSLPPSPRARSGSRKLIPILIAAVGIVLLAGAGAGIWYFRNHAAPKKAEVATVATQPSQPAPPANPTDSTANAVPPLAPLPPEPTPEPKKAPRPARKKTAAEPAKTAPPPPAPVPEPIAPPPPPPEKTAEAPKPKPATPRIQMVPVMIQDGMPFRVTLVQDVPANAPDGSDVRFTVVDDLRNSDNVVVIAKGATVTGKVVAAGGKKFLGMGGSKTSYELEKVEGVDGKKLNVRALAGRNADGAALHAFETPNGRKAKGYAALQGTEYIAYTEGDQTVSVQK
ncbi:MAG TPA: protein kinase [Bryobacteraceae bacterium]|nr:protein kinase [Bryobacteraceae bacterium]